MTWGSKRTGDREVMSRDRQKPQCGYSNLRNCSALHLCNTMAECCQAWTSWRDGPVAKRMTLGT